MWWYEHRGLYPHLSVMALDYLSIPATLIDVGRLFSCGRLLLSHLHSWLSAQSTHALLCPNYWSPLVFIKAQDLTAITSLPDVIGGEDELESGWDAITID
ncbi:hypothetical protein PAXRUDRAFT_146663 [Paxillus rubicundulus Ve08.2h10]|uniref:HAT C-terminal dimerisation domain-containing protein n=1 Tax=Paxillus rubicundulus Ve08.2h10 TaxID=930991 RepID=A0A0D0E5G4_9AGAM|nr:hypothetical protein PAXRUDRAFT_146663 [Paxillus rubicundulus Ve08.2h10]